MQIYEYPGNELIRVALKFEHLYNKAKCFSEDPHTYCAQTAVMTIAELVSLIDRVDLRTMLTREFSRHLANLRRLADTPQVDYAKLEQIISELENTVTKLYRDTGLFAKDIFDSYFLQTIRRQSGPAGSTTPYNMPELEAWQHQNAQTRMQQCQLWLSYFFDLNQMFYFLLQMIRENVAPRTVLSNKGIYQQSIHNPGLCQMIRVWLPHHCRVFPKFSLSQRKINIRLLNSNINSKHEQVNESIEFDIAVASF